MEVTYEGCFYYLCFNEFVPRRMKDFSLSELDNLSYNLHAYEVFEIKWLFLF